MVLPPKPIHPEGEPKELGKPLSSATIEVDTFEGKIHVEWEPGASVTPNFLINGQVITPISVINTS